MAKTKKKEVHKITCPHCKKSFNISAGEYDAILQQVKNSEFDKELRDKLKNERDRHENALEEWYFLDRTNGLKVPVKELEIYISRFIRALTSCGLETAVSCDGNHKRLGNKVWLGFDSEANDMYYEAICKNVLNKRFNYKFSKKMPLCRENQYNLYNKLNSAANFLFDNREYFRNLKKKFYKRFEFKYLYNDNNQNEICEKFDKYLNEEVKWEIKYA